MTESDRIEAGREVVERFKAPKAFREDFTRRMEQILDLLRLQDVPLTPELARDAGDFRESVASLQRMDLLRVAQDPRGEILYFEAARRRALPTPAAGTGVALARTAGGPGGQRRASVAHQHLPSRLAAERGCLSRALGTRKGARRTRGGLHPPPSACGQQQCWQRWCGGADEGLGPHLP